jgi:hypothetical protein
MISSKILVRFIVLESLHYFRFPTRSISRRLQIDLTSVLCATNRGEDSSTGKVRLFSFTKFKISFLLFWVNLNCEKYKSRHGIPFLFDLAYLQNYQSSFFLFLNTFSHFLKKEYLPSIFHFQ